MYFVNSSNLSDIDYPIHYIEFVVAFYVYTLVQLLVD